MLAGVTGKIRHGRVTAVMGPSGAGIFALKFLLTWSGKTTFLTTLSGKVASGKVTGDVLINGQKKDIKDFKKDIGFVPQEDIMLRMMTVKEILKFSGWEKALL